MKLNFLLPVFVLLPARSNAGNDEDAMKALLRNRRQAEKREQRYQAKDAEREKLILGACGALM